MATESPQRSYRAPCPGCGAPVEFRSAQSTHVVCGYCQSTLLRQGETLARLGKMAELFDDHSPLQLQARGTWNNKAFTLVGRLQYKYGEGTWTEWHAVRDDGTSAYLSEDNGAYVFSTPLETPRKMPAAENFQVGSNTAINGKPFGVASRQTVALMSAQGELPHLPALGQPFAMVELRSQGTGTVGRDETVLSIDYSTQPPCLSLGKPVVLEALQLSGLRDASVKDEKGRPFNCPNCGAPVTVSLAKSQSITCSACNSLINLSQGAGAELEHALQSEPVTPLIPLGSQGPLQGVVWQVVGFQHRMGRDPNDPDEPFGWEEYLLYNTQRGFIFLVDSTQGWSLVKPTTGAPVLSDNGQSATYLGVRYALKEVYNADTTYAAGEFYWQVQRGQKTSNRDFGNGKNTLSMEQSPQEVTWSVGCTIESDALARAFKLEDKKELLHRSDASPASAAKGVSMWVVIVVVVLCLLFFYGLNRRLSCDPAVETCNTASSGSSRSSGGSFGGFSSGGGHK